MFSLGFNITLKANTAVLIQQLHLNLLINVVFSKTDPEMLLASLDAKNLSHYHHICTMTGQYLIDRTK